MEPQVTILGITKYINGDLQSVKDSLAIEEPLEIKILYRVNGEPILENISVTMRTPGNDVELAIGFLFTEGFIQNIEDVDIEKCRAIEGANSVIIVLSPTFSGDTSKLKRSFFTTSSCGVCGKESIESVQQVCRFSNIPMTPLPSAELILCLPDKLRNAQRVFADTGGIHASGLFDEDGRLILLREDVGRHNALDKLIGAALIEHLPMPLSGHILLLSGRASFELIQKAAMAGIKNVCAVGAPSNLAVSLAKENNIRLIGFLKKDRFNIYN